MYIGYSCNSTTKYNLISQYLYNVLPKKNYPLVQKNTNIKNSRMFLKLRTTKRKALIIILKL